MSYILKLAIFILVASLCISKNHVSGQNPCNFYFGSILKCEDITDLSLVSAEDANESSIETIFLLPKSPLKFDRNLTFAGSEDKFKDNYKLILENFKSGTFDKKQWLPVLQNILLVGHENGAGHLFGRSTANQSTYLT